MYLDADEHKRLRRLAADREVSMTSLVREAVGRYLVEEGATELPTLDELTAALEQAPRYRGCAPGVAGLAERMRRRQESSWEEEGAALSAEDQEVGEALASAHEAALASWRAQA